MTNKSNSFIENKTQLIQYFKDGIKKDTDLRIGVEHEKFLFNKTDLKRINYDQIKKIFEILKNKGWEPQLDDVDIGPMVSLAARDEVHDQVQRSISVGATLNLGGEIPEGEGSFYPVTMLSNVSPGMPAFDLQEREYLPLMLHLIDEGKL